MALSATLTPILLSRRAGLPKFGVNVALSATSAPNFGWEGEGGGAREGLCSGVSLGPLRSRKSEGHGSTAAAAITPLTVGLERTDVNVTQLVLAWVPTDGG